MHVARRCGASLPRLRTPATPNPDARGGPSKDQFDVGSGVHLSGPETSVARHGDPHPDTSRGSDLSVLASTPQLNRRPGGQGRKHNIARPE
eukprot:67508-Lingulodinium_polyedra.AAC.1